MPQRCQLSCPEFLSLGRDSPYLVPDSFDLNFRSLLANTSDYRTKTISDCRSSVPSTPSKHNEVPSPRLVVVY